MEEQNIWKDIIGYNGAYQISKNGAVKSSNRIIKSITGQNRLIIGRIMKPKNKEGYHFVTLSLNGEIKNHYIHRLVAEAYLPNPKNKPHINHIDGDKSNNNINNLEWVTISENTNHAYRIGLSQNIGGTHSFAQKLIDNCTGKIYSCIKEAAVELEINYNSLRNMLCGSNNNKTCLDYYSKG